MNDSSRSEPRRLGVAPLSAPDSAPADYIRAAAAAGYSSVGLRVFPVGTTDQLLATDTHSSEFRLVRDALDETGTDLLDIEVLTVTPDISRERWLPGMAAGEALGARLLNIVGADDSMTRFSDTVAHITVDARDHGLLPVLEPVAYRAFNSFPLAFSVAEAAGCAVELDMLHFIRTGASVETIAANSALVAIVQICDAPASVAEHGDALRALATDDSPAALEISESRSHRLLPADGAAPIAELLRVLDHDIPISVEIPNTVLRGERSAADYLGLLHQATSTFLDGLPAEQAPPRQRRRRS